MRMKGMCVFACPDASIHCVSWGGGVNLDSQRLRCCRSLWCAVMYHVVGMADMRAVHAQAIQASTEQEELKALNSLEEVFKRHKWVC